MRARSAGLLLAVLLGCSGGRASSSGGTGGHSSTSPGSGGGGTTGTGGAGTGGAAVAERIWGVTIDDVSNLTAIVDALQKLPARPTARVVFDKGVAPADYA